MKNLLLAITLTMLVGCATLDHNGDTPHEARVRAWLTEQVASIHERRDEADLLLEKGVLDWYEHRTINKYLDREMESLPRRVPKDL